MDNQTRDRIIEAAVELFNYKGYKNVTLSEIAGHLGISKKTIYQFFSSKDEIAEGVLLFLTKKKSSQVQEIKNSEQDPEVKLREIIKMARTGMSLVNPLFLEDIRKYIPNLQEELKNIKQERILIIEAIIREGQEWGTFRGSVDPRLAAAAYFEIVQSVSNPSIIASLRGYSPGYSSDEVIDFLLEVFLNGVCSK